MAILLIDFTKIPIWSLSFTKWLKLLSKEYLSSFIFEP